jgi:hypothetical protein
MINSPGQIGQVIVQINDLKQSLWGNGVPPVTASAEVNGGTLADALQSLKVEIDKFLLKG